jgi:hypothetical protein
VCRNKQFWLSSHIRRWIVSNENCSVRQAKDGTLRFRKVIGCVLALALVGPVAGEGADSAPPLLADEVVARMERRFEQQVQALGSYEGRRKYVAAHPLLKRPSVWLVEERFHAPEEKQLKVLERSGPSIVERQLFSRLLEVELETARGAQRLAVELCRRNYRFTFRAYDSASKVYVFAVEPRTSNPYLLRGTVWIHSEDFAVTRIEGEPAARHSFWVKESHFVHEFARFGEFWLPVRHHSEAELRIFGRATLDINYFAYRWQERRQGEL